MGPGTVKNGVSQTNMMAMAIVSKIGMPPSMQKQRREDSEVWAKVISSKFEKREAQVTKMMHAFHKERASGLHWYVYVAAVHPEHQGKKCCRAMFDFIAAL